MPSTISPTCAEHATGARTDSYVGTPCASDHRGTRGSCAGQATGARTGSYVGIPWASDHCETRGRYAEHATGARTGSYDGIPTLLMTRTGGTTRFPRDRRSIQEFRRFCEGREIALFSIEMGSPRKFGFSRQADFRLVKKSSPG